MTLTWTIRPEQVWPQFTQAQIDGLEADLVAFAQSMTSEITAHMKAAHVWQNRTGDAESSLFTALIHEARSIVGLLLSHGSLIDYSVYLEYDHAGRFAILAPSVDLFAPQFFEGVRRIVRARFG